MDGGGCRHARGISNMANTDRHIMTGIGAYFYIVWGIWLRHCLNGRQEEYILQWPSLFTSLPHVVRADGMGRGGKNLKKL